ncbi:hypothetical protein [Pseudaminobacter soli (ex Li et al. 2025)]|uniref:Uncharacterized protein n=1 Tax=Pseudaminobacter soli (ex Li et al. 2025) TaxID=1295366 RepID=A0A2P7SE77_9HYPH|nr:hypothetical protein [Mesorhizobium soli]PSJ60780.1 hypothetical protein C7I85_12115 [Mesorhizobium soli]
MSWDFHVGQRVVCVIGGGHGYHPDVKCLTEGRVYTIRAIRLNPETGILNVHLEEIVNSARDCLEEYGEPYYSASRFRPVVQRETDIEVFLRMLNPSKQRVDA